MVWESPVRVMTLRTSLDRRGSVVRGEVEANSQEAGVRVRTSGAGGIPAVAGLASERQGIATSGSRDPLAMSQAVSLIHNT